MERYEKGYRFDCNGWIYVHIEGGPRERGIQYGHLVAPELADAMKTMEAITLDKTGREWGFFVKAAEKLYGGQNSIEEFLEEIKGIAEGAASAGVEITWQEVLAWNAQMEMFGEWYPGVVGESDDDLDEDEHCSAFIANGSYTRDGKAVIAHNNWDRYVTGQFANVVLDVQPESGHRILMNAYPGYTASMTDYFVTDAGIMGTETTIGGYSGYDPEKLAEFYRMRNATRYANDMDEWVSMMLDNNNGGYANSWLLADTGTNEIMRFELGLKYHSIERTDDGFFVGFNSASDPRIRNLECGGDPGYYDLKSPCGARRVRLTQLMNEYRGEIETKVAETILADHYDVFLQKANNLCSRTIDAHYHLDPMEYRSTPTYLPHGALDGKVTDSELAEDMSFIARWGNSSGMPFDASEYLNKHPQWDNLEGLLKDRPTQPWTLFRSGQE